MQAGATLRVSCSKARPNWSANPNALPSWSAGWTKAQDGLASPFCLGDGLAAYPAPSNKRAKGYKQPGGSAARRSSDPELR